jgi:hypothetical protein
VWKLAVVGLSVQGNLPACLYLENEDFYFIREGGCAS